ncbi:MAG TPA: carbohydrate ABC transporter permease [Clostridiaceae bacterium]|nr:carbohydrate ABC transporter permease [Clostridiaceae bacterium]
MNRRSSLIFLEVLIIFATIFFLYPIIIGFLNTFKPFRDIMADAISLPKGLYLTNYVTVWDQMQYFKKLLNSLVICLVSIVAIVVLSALCAYKLSRDEKRIPASRIIFIAFVSSMVIPFHAIMIPTIQEMKFLNLINTLEGVIIFDIGGCCPLAVFLYHGFIKTVPLELEECARIDGCNTLRVFVQIVFPLLSPITVMVIVLNTINIWNDFLFPYLVLSSKSKMTLPLALFQFVGRYMKEWDKMLAGSFLCMAPIVIFYFILQRYIIKGIVMGSIKG